ncbi:hypothetical protein BKA67DRAFT_685727 [Truncatella angustata]|uniref:Uncharacterized protein n=1 Tax=Truncatella angustata TaxID=152316 RepID=A0A9P8UVW2_9PEZI|nr:uncharacterized protein BKA67DRAFT_685727 [Truncatella angustata]KAH6659145.1 hypothetical protein BKA67DRAFT_685727 [Truncatella angustata]KAH8204895.1 hypothetical protein TruAng_000934 [Truncatella angustata]
MDNLLLASASVGQQSGDGQSHAGLTHGDTSFFDFDLSVFESPNIEDIYAEVHRSIDQIHSMALSQTAFAPDRIKEENSKVVEKLFSLEHDVVRRSSTTPNSSSAGQSLAVVHPLSMNTPNNSWIDTSPLDVSQYPSFFNGFDGGTAGTPAVNSQPSPPASEHSHTSRGSPTLRPQARPKRRKLYPRGKDSKEKSDAQPDDATCVLAVLLRNSPKLAQKFLEIGKPEIVAEAEEFAMQLQDPKYRGASQSLPEPYSFPGMSHIRDGSGFLRMLPKLALAIECNIFGEQNHKIKKRIAMAHFYHAYTLAQENPQTFLSWCDEHQISKSMLPKGNHKSMVQHRFADLMFPPDQKKYEGADWRKTRISKIQVWRKSGKHWAKLIMRFGHGILLLIPPSVTDEDLRVAHDDEMAAILDLIESREHLFADALRKANEAFRSQPLVGQERQLIQGLGESERAGWDHLLN